MTDQQDLRARLPNLPPPSTQWGGKGLYTADQMRAYALEAAATLANTQDDVRTIVGLDWGRDEADEDGYVIDRLSHLLAEIAVIVNGPEPPLTAWSYHDLPAKVSALIDQKKAREAAAQLPMVESEGWVLVPMKPTQRMLQEGWERLPVERLPNDTPLMDFVYYIYEAMLANAPQPDNKEWR